MIQGANPTLRWTVKNAEGLDLTQALQVWATLRQGAKIINRTGESLGVEATSVTLHLTQEEALSLTPGAAEIQVNWLYRDAEDGTIRRAETKVGSIKITKTLLEEVLTYGDGV